MSDGEGELTLRVAKAIPSDVGHGRARAFDNDLNLSPGDGEINGEKSTAAIVGGQARGRQPGNLNDGIIRKNASYPRRQSEHPKVEVTECEKLVFHR